MKTDEELQSQVLDAIKWEPLLKGSEIGATSKDGVISLIGIVDSFAKKEEAEDAAKRVNGVKAVVEKIEIQFQNKNITTDNEIALGIVNIFKWNSEFPEESIKVKVERGWVTLEGTLELNSQKDAAKRSIRSLKGIIGITNNIKIESVVQCEIEKKDIEYALSIQWSMKGSDIEVEVSEKVVRLTGTVSSWLQKKEAERIAWNAPGITMVNNEILVEYDYSIAD